MFNFWILLMIVSSNKYYTQSIEQGEIMHNRKHDISAETCAESYKTNVNIISGIIIFFYLIIIVKHVF